MVYFGGYKYKIFLSDFKKKFCNNAVLSTIYFSEVVFMDELFNIMEDIDARGVRMFVSGAVAIIDNVKKVMIMSDNNITVDHGKGQLSLYGAGLDIQYIYDGRIRVQGNFSGVEFFSKNSNKDQKMRRTNAQKGGW